MPSDIAILDTNVLLDWLVFDDPRLKLLGDAIVAGRVRWLATSTMRDEFSAVLRRGFGDRWRSVSPGSAHAAWQRWCEPVATPAVASLAIPRCRDPDDQMFVDLAAHAGARWLFSRDRALLALRRPLAGRGIDVLLPERWRP